MYSSSMPAYNEILVEMLITISSSLNNIEAKQQKQNQNFYVSHIWNIETINYYL